MVEYITVGIGLANLVGLVLVGKQVHAGRLDTAKSTATIGHRIHASEDRLGVAVGAAAGETVAQLSALLPKRRARKVSQEPKQ